LDGAGKPIRWGAGGVQPQDLVLYDGQIRHIGIVFQDREPRGVFDPGDVIVHTLMEAPTFAGVSEAYDATFSVIRLREPVRAMVAAPARPRGTRPGS
jgi:hypothetical protein